MKRKNLILLFLLLAAMGCLLLGSARAAEAVRTGLRLCAQSVIPSLFPFFVLSTLFISLGFARQLGTVLARPARTLFHCGGAGGIAFLLGIIGGYPVGGRTVGELYIQGLCEKKEAEHLLAFCNNSGPAFILGIAGVTLFSSSRVGAWLYLIHVLSAVLSGIALRPRQAPPLKKPSAAGAPSFASAFIGAVQSGFSAILNVCGFVIFFLVILSFFSYFTGLHQGLILGLLELTNGILSLTPDRAGFLSAAVLLGFGGLSVHCQTAAVLSGTDLSLKYYWLGKLMQAGFSFLLAIPISRLFF